MAAAHWDWFIQASLPLPMISNGFLSQTMRTLRDPHRRLLFNLKSQQGLLPQERTIRTLHTIQQAGYGIARGLLAATRNFPITVFQAVGFTGNLHPSPLI